MKSPTISQLRGVVRIIVRGASIEKLINEASTHGIEVWDLKPLKDGQMEMSLRLTDFFELRPLLKGTGSKMRIKNRTGMPFFIVRLWRRKGFIIGFALFVAIIFTLSSLVWDIEVEGNEKIATEDILAAARTEGIYPYQWIFRLPAQDRLSANMTRKLPGTSWVGVSRSGTRVTIQVVEATDPREKELMSPRHLISTSDAVITHIFAEKGQPEVSKNDRVKKGQILITGFQGGKAVVSKGEVKGIVWHEYNIEVPLLRKQNVYTGEKKKRGYLFFGNTAIQLSGYGKTGFSASQTLTEFDPLTWRKLKLPMGWMTEKEYETTEIEIKLTPANAQTEGIERAKRDISAKYGVDSVILGQKILHEKTDNGKVYMKVLFEVEQNIAEEVPIVDDQGE